LPRVEEALRALGLLLASAICSAAPAPDLHPAEELLARMLPAQAQRFELRALRSDDGHERFRISGEDGHIVVAGSSVSAVLFGVNWYLKYTARVQVSPEGDRLGAGERFPLPAAPIERESPYRWRYALNENVDGYTTAYWDWPRWQREIDVLALSGINAMLVERGMDMVLYRTFRDFGYTDEELRGWITQPAHQNWQLMGNLCCFNGPTSTALLERRVQSAQRIVARLRELGITPVLPGFYGIVPAGFARRFPQAHVLPQGEWAGFTRPDWLDPRDPMFARVAAAFYRHQHELFGDTAVYDMEVFQEGGTSGDVPVAEAAHAVQGALWTAHPGALWMMLAWQGNPRPELLAGVDRSALFIVDIDHDRVPRDDREKDFQGAPFLFGGLWQFGGRTTLGANTANITARLQRLGAANHNMEGTALFTEGIDTNPFAFDLFTEMAWRHEPVDLARWTADYVARRYGGLDPHALAAWRMMIATAYDLRIDRIVFNSERDAPQESLFNAQPSLGANRASNWAPEGMRYDAERFKVALRELLAVAPRLRAHGYDYDLVDIARQALANESRRLLPLIASAYARKDLAAFGSLTQRWLALMDLEDRLLSTHGAFLLGSWLAYVGPWASTPEERARLEYDARSLLTTWGDRKASEGAALHDYGNRDWAGLVRGYYRLRWQTFFNALGEELRSGVPAAPIDWFALGDKWNHDGDRYADEPRGDPHGVALEAGRALGIVH
jgi:alpha-N-acetylglucosaminidase